MKLTSKFYGPYIVIKKLSVVAYELKLPTTAMIHPINKQTLKKSNLRISQSSKQIHNYTYIEAAGEHSD